MINTYPATLDRLHDMLDFVKACALGAGFDNENVVKIELAVEEALVNVINYGYPNMPGSLSLECESSRAKGFGIVIKDQGIPYNPLTNPAPFDPTANIQNQKIGGYGIFLILKIMDEVKYERIGESNILTLIKYRN